MNQKSLKKVVRRLRKPPKNTPSLCHILINIKSVNGAARWTMYQLKHILADKSLSRECGQKRLVIQRFGDCCFECIIQRPSKGRKTYVINGVVMDSNPFELPF